MSAWLDRFAAQTGSTPSPIPHRPAVPSPLPRRSLTLPPIRPSLPSRASSVSLVSEANLPAAARLPQQSSALRNQLSSSPPPNIRNPLETLADVLGVPAADLTRHDEHKSTINEEDIPSELFDNAQFDGLGLEEFMESSSVTRATPSLYSHSQQSVEKCMFIKAFLLASSSAQRE